MPEFETLKRLAEDVQRDYNMSPRESYVTVILSYLIVEIIIVAVCILGWWLAQKINRLVFRQIEKRQGDRLYIQFMRKVASAVITVLFIIIPFNLDHIRSSLFGSAAILTAVVGFAAQDVIKDVLSGLQISLYHPFDVGDRIELEDGTVGIVESITMRHVVINRIDTVKVVIPNSKMNGFSVVNYSYGDIPRSAIMKYPISYDADIAKAKKVIEEAIKDLPFTFAGRRLKDGTMQYGKVYFLELADSALIMTVTIYYESSYPTEFVKDMVNTRIFEALKENNIEIPYNHMTVELSKEETQISSAGAAAVAVAAAAAVADVPAGTAAAAVADAPANTAAEASAGS